MVCTCDEDWVKKCIEYGVEGGGVAIYLLRGGLFIYNLLSNLINYMYSYNIISHVCIYYTSI